jgi:hypothetical protein
MMDINPRIGIGDIRFGMQRDEVIAILGAEQTWEEWMGGNLNDSLFYPGIILYFDAHDSYGPLPEGMLVQIEVSSKFPCNLLGRDLNTITREIVLSSIASSTDKHFPNRSIEVLELSMHFFFKPDDTLKILRFTAEEAPEKALETDRTKPRSG